jgi:hypothetical protein
MALRRVKLAEINQPERLGIAGALNHPAVRKTVRVRAVLEEPNLGLIPAVTVVVTDMTWLMHVFQSMDEETQSDTAILDGATSSFKRFYSFM